MVSSGEMRESHDHQTEKRWESQKSQTCHSESKCDRAEGETGETKGAIENLWRHRVMIFIIQVELETPEQRESGNLFIYKKVWQRWLCL